MCASFSDVFCVELLFITISFENILCLTRFLRLCIYPIIEKEQMVSIYVAPVAETIRNDCKKLSILNPSRFDIRWVFSFCFSFLLYRNVIMLSNYRLIASDLIFNYEWHSSLYRKAHTFIFYFDRKVVSCDSNQHDILTRIWFLSKL